MGELRLAKIELKKSDGIEEVDLAASVIMKMIKILVPSFHHTLINGRNLNLETVENLLLREGFYEGFYERFFISESDRRSAEENFLLIKVYLFFRQLLIETGDGLQIKSNIKTPKYKNGLLKARDVGKPMIYYSGSNEILFLGLKEAYDKGKHEQERIHLIKEELIKFIDNLKKKGSRSKGLFYDTILKVIDEVDISLDIVPQVTKDLTNNLREKVMEAEQQIVNY